MAFQDLREYIAALESQRDLKRIAVPADPVLEITEIADRAVKAGGPALLFEQVTGSPYPVAINLFGTLKRACCALGVTSFDEIAERIVSFIPQTPPDSLMDKVKFLFKLKEIGGFQPKKVSSGPVQDVIERTPDLFTLPVLKCWPQDAGRFITLPLVITGNPHTGQQNVGMYRIQILSEDKAIMHWHVHHDGANNFRMHKEMGRDMEVAIALGGDPATIYAATAPLPPGLENLVNGIDPGFGYAVLAQLISHEKYGRHCNVILTTNFDDLVADALYLFTNKKPLIISHESLISFAKISRTRPMVIKLHGDARISPKNTEEETTKLDQTVKSVTKSFLCETGIIFIGYGGNDKSITDLFNNFPQKPFPWGIYWVGDYLPDNAFGKLLIDHEIIWVKHFDFDELMLLIREEFKFEHPNDKRFDKIMDSYNETFGKLKNKIEGKAESPEKVLLEQAANKAAKEFANWLSVELEARKYKLIDKEKAEKIYQNGIILFPKSRQLLNNYGNFLNDIRKDYDKAEEYYKKAIEVDPKYARAMSNFAVFLKDTRKNYDKAEEYFIKAVEADNNYAPAMGNYAIFLKEIRKDNNKAEEYFKKAVEADPDYAPVFGNYAIFLKEIRKDYDKAEEYYKKAIEVDPKYARVMSNYAIFLKDIRKDYDKAEEYFKRAVGVDPQIAQALGNYALFLKEIRKDYDKAEEYYKKAIEVDPKYTRALSNYAIFLYDIRNDNNKAEDYFRRALEVEPKDARAMSSYASFLRDVLKDYDKAEDYYKKAIEADPNFSIILNSYSTFLGDIRKDYVKAEEYLKKAIGADPNNNVALSNYCELLFILGRQEEAIEILHKVLSISPEGAAILDCWFYSYAHLQEEKERTKALSNINKLISKDLRAPNADFDNSIQCAIHNGHPEPEFLKVLADVITDKAKAEELDKFPVWKNISA